MAADCCGGRYLGVEAAAAAATAAAWENVFKAGNTVFMCGLGAVCGCGAPPWCAGT